MTGVHGVLSTCPSPPSPPPPLPPLPPTPPGVMEPRLSYVRDLFTDPAGFLRDPSSPIQDPATTVWLVEVPLVKTAQC